MPAVLAFPASLRRFEKRLAASLRGLVVQADLDEKHRKMEEDPFTFLRATCWRWAETVPALVPELMDAPVVLSLGDAHLDNFGLWRDSETRLVWGANDFDEAWPLPYTQDLLRLATSALLARGKLREPSGKTIAAAVLRGYREGLKTPGPLILTVENAWLRKLFSATPKQRAEFLPKFAKDRKSEPPRRFRAALVASLPNDATAPTFRARRAGAGGLGQPRWTAIAAWRGGEIVRETKALVPSSWRTRFPKGPSDAPERLAFGRYRSPDAHLAFAADLPVRRLAPDSRNLEYPDDFGSRSLLRLLHVMAHELASLHAGTPGGAKRIKADLKSRPRGWLLAAAKLAARQTEADFGTWQHHRKAHKR